MWVSGDSEIREPSLPLTWVVITQSFPNDLTLTLSFGFTSLHIDLIFNHLARTADCLGSLRNSLKTISSTNVSEEPKIQLCYGRLGGCWNG